MSLLVQSAKSYDTPVSVLYQAALGAVEGLEGSVITQDRDKSEIQAKFDKKILGHVLGDRTQIKVMIVSEGDNKNSVSIECFPLDAVGRKLMFGARKGVTETVVSWFFAHLEHRLQKSS